MLHDLPGLCSGRLIVQLAGELKPDQITAEAVYTDVETTGKFESSNELFNSINKIWWRSQTDNMHGGIASDCPHRERSPYTGDGQVSCVTVMHNFDVRLFYTKWIQDILGAQNAEDRLCTQWSSMATWLRRRSGLGSSYQYYAMGILSFITGIQICSGIIMKV